MTSNVLADKSRRRVNILSIKKKELLSFRQPRPSCLSLRVFAPRRGSIASSIRLHMRAEQTKPLNPRDLLEIRSIAARSPRPRLSRPRLPAGWNGHLAETRPLRANEAPVNGSPRSRGYAARKNCGSVSRRGRKNVGAHARAPCARYQRKI